MDRKVQTKNSRGCLRESTNGILFFQAFIVILLVSNKELTEYNFKIMSGQISLQVVKKLE